MAKIKITILLCLLISCNTSDYRYKVTGQVQTKTGQHSAIWYTNKLLYKGDTAYYVNSDSSMVTINPPYEVEQLEKHFPCTIDKVLSETGIHGYITECGIFFESKESLAVGDTLEGVISPKHK